MTSKLSQTLYNVINLKKIFLSATIYALATFPGKLLLTLIPGTEVRIAACLPVVFGMLWGLPGAMGIAIGNLCSDLYGGESLNTCFWGCLSNFILAYLPYRLWYGWRSSDAIRFIYDTKSCLRFFTIIFAVVFNFSVILAAIILSEFETNPWHSFGIFFSSNFDFTLLFGIPLLLYFRKKHFYFAHPEKNSIAIKSTLPLKIFVLASGLSLIFLIGIYNNLIDKTIAQGFLFISTLLLLYACTLKPSYDESLATAPNFYSIGAKATMVILMLAIITIILIIALSFHAHLNIAVELNNLGLWQAIFSTLLLSINFVFIAVLLILYQLEYAIVNPITRLSQFARDFVDNNYRNPAKKFVTIKKNAPKNEIEELQQSFEKMTQDLQTYISEWKTITQEQEAIAAQLSVGSQIQQSFLPDTAIINRQLHGFKLMAGMYPAKEVGGDLYDCFLIDHDKLAILIADVSGKGIPAALFMMVTKTLLKSKSNLKNPAQILAEVNNALTEHNENMMFVTVWLGIIELSTGQLTYANAGHNYPLLHHGNDEVIWLKEKSGPALGIISNLTYKNYERSISHDSKLLLYTDGISEAENPRHEFYGTERLAARFKRANIPEDILFSIQEFAEGTPQSDDITILWLQRK